MVGMQKFHLSRWTKYCALNANYGVYYSYFIIGIGLAYLVLLNKHNLKNHGSIYCNFKSGRFVIYYTISS